MQLLKLALLAALFLPGGCASTGASSSIAKAQAAVSKETMDAARGSGKVKLLNHQLVPIEYLRKNPDVKGIIVNHYMGTGKTFLGLGVAQAFPDHPVIVLAPRFLESHWKNQIAEYGVSHPERIRFVSYQQAPSVLSKMDLSKHVILADEAHNLIKYLHSLDREANARFTELYANLRKAYKIVALTGTPIYSDESDIAYLINLVSGQDLMPFNQEMFRLQYSKIIPNRQFWRGYVTESNMLPLALPMFLSFFSTALLGPVGLAVGIPLGLTPIIINLTVSPTSFRLRKLDVDKMDVLLNKYVSYFRFDETQFKDFPKQEFEVKGVAYNRQQYSLFLHLVEGELDVLHLKQLLGGDKNSWSDEFIKINSSQMHDQIYNTPGAGRDIGNFAFKEPEGRVIEPPKFKAILAELNQHQEQTVLYSNYYETGIVAFEEFLKRNNYKEPFAIIEPNMSPEKVNKIVARYNDGHIRLLLLHPEITEGISLKGTQYLHILEPMLNPTVLEQVVGRTRRYQSHTHLPAKKQMVHVTMWQSTSGSWDPQVGDLKRANWFKRYRELAYMSRWGIGIAQVDKNFAKKALNPEELSLMKLNTLEKNLKEIQATLTQKSLEQGRAK
jgi:hypothetical protein